MHPQNLRKNFNAAVKSFYASRDLLVTAVKKKGFLPRADAEALEQNLLAAKTELDKTIAEVQKHLREHHGRK